MAFFAHRVPHHTPRHVFNGAGPFQPFFRLLDDIDTISRQGNQCNSNLFSAPTPTWTPKFDIRETGDAYELHGELPGVSKENVSIEFSEPQALVVKGKVERSYTTGTSPAHVEESTASGAITDNTETVTQSPPRSPRQATVEDDDQTEGGWEDVSEKRQQQEAEKPQEQQRQVAPQQQEQKKPTDSAKYWLSERSIGQFTRTFNFPDRVEQDNVSASFKDGILSITVPKAKKYEARRISIL